MESVDSCQNEASKSAPPRPAFVAQFQSSLVEDWRGTLKAVNEGSSQIADARSAARFLGQVSVCLFVCLLLLFIIDNRILSFVTYLYICYYCTCVMIGSGATSGCSRRTYARSSFVAIHRTSKKR